MNSDHDACLQRIIEFLLDDSKWALDGMPDSSVSPQQRNTEVLRNDIKSLLGGDDISSSDLNRIYRHIALEDRISQGAHKHAKTFLCSIRIYGFHNQKLNSEELEWLKAKDLMARLLAIDRMKCEMEDIDINIKGDAIRELRKFGYEIPLDKGRFGPTPSDERKFGNAMQYRFDKIGAIAIGIILDNIRRLYREDTGRYDFRPEPATIGKPHIVPPWGYLLNVALSFIRKKQGCRRNDIKKTVDEILYLAGKYFIVLELQPLSKFTDIFRPYAEIVDEIEEGILYQQHVALDQYPLEVILEIIKNLEYAVKPERSSHIVDVLEWICKNKQCERPETLRFTRTEIEQGLADVLSEDKVAEVLDSLTIKDSELNSGYFIPHEVWKRNYYKRPFVLSDGYYILFDTNLWAKGFYHAWLEKLGAGVNLGLVFETVAQRLLSAKDINFLAEEKYTISSEERKLFGIASEEGECDFIIDTDKKIYFIELKKKEITGNAMSGDGLAALTDMSQSVLKAFIQAGKHELILRRRGEIEFISGNKIVLGDKRVEKIHISAFDHYGLHDKMLIVRLLTSLIRCDFSCSDESKLIEFRKVQDEFRTIVSCDIVTEAYSGGDYLHTFRSYSLPQFIFLLDNCQAEKDFVKQLEATARLTMGTKDWYNEQVFMAGVRKC